MLRYYSLLSLVFLVSLGKISSAQKYFVHGNRPYIILSDESASSDSFTDQESTDYPPASEIIYRSDIPISDVDYRQISEYEAEPENVEVPLQRSSEFGFQVSKNPRPSIRHWFRRPHHNHHHDSSHYGHHGYGHESSYGHGWNSGGWHGGYGGYGSHSSGHGGHDWQNNDDGYGHVNIGGTHSFYIGSGSNHGYGHGFEYDKTKLKYGIFKLKAKKKIAALQAGINVNKAMSSVLQATIKGLGWLR